MASPDRYSRKPVANRRSGRRRRGSELTIGIIAVLGVVFVIWMMVTLS